MFAQRFLTLILIVFLQACGGSGSSTPTKDSTPSSSSTASTTVSSAASSLSSTSSVSSSTSSLVISSPSSATSSTSSQSSSFSSQTSSTQADLPVGIAQQLPVLNLNTDGAATIESKETYINGSFSLVNGGNTASSGTLQVRGRGNSTWAWPKKPYRLKLTTSTALLGMPANKNWVLLANYADKTLMRNDIAFMFSRHIGMEYTPRLEYVELNLNGVYQGVYQLVEHIRVDKNRVNIPEMKVTDTAADTITGGYLMEVDFRHNIDYCVNSAWDPVCVNGVNTSRNVDFCIDSKHGMQPACLSSPDTLHDAAWSAQRAYIEKYYADMEAALFSSNFTDPTKGYAAYLDVDSVINYYLINEVFKNVDGAVSSFNIYKKRGGKLFFGPVWDFDLGLGNAGYDDADKTYGWHIRKASWFARLFEDPAFVAKVKARWVAIKNKNDLNYIYQYAQARAHWLDAQQQKNYLLWSITDVDGWVMHNSVGSYDLEVKEFIHWQQARVDWIDSQLGK